MSSPYLRWVLVLFPLTAGACFGSFDCGVDFDDCDSDADCTNGDICTAALLGRTCQLATRCDSDADCTYGATCEVDVVIEGDNPFEGDDTVLSVCRCDDASVCGDTETSTTSTASTTSGQGGSGGGGAGGGGTGGGGDTGGASATGVGGSGATGSGGAGGSADVGTGGSATVGVGGAGGAQ